MGKGKTLFVDEDAYKILNEQKEILRMNGFGNPTFSDAVRLLGKKLKVQFDEVVK
jgi:predicted CopG family antitoxin